MQPHDLAEAEDARASAVLLHPHPDMGGDRFNNVVAALYEALPLNGVTAVRFDFSSSRLDVARRETVEMLDLVGSAYLVGYSFGGLVAGDVVDDRVLGWFLVAPPPSVTASSAYRDARPRHVVAAEHDQFFPADQIHADTIVAGADHFFVGRTDVVVAACLRFLKEVAP